MYNVILIPLLLIMFYGCFAGSPLTVNTYQPKDNISSCQELNSEFEDMNSKIESEIQIFNKEHNSSGSLGFFYRYPNVYYAGMGSRKATEVESYRKRAEYLQLLLKGKNCGFRPMSVR